MRVQKQLQIKALFESSGFSVNEFARQVGADRRLVFRWVRKGRPPAARRLPQIARALGVTVDELYIEDGPAATNGHKEEEHAPHRVG